MSESVRRGKSADDASHKILRLRRLRSCAQDDTDYAQDDTFCSCLWRVDVGIDPYDKHYANMAGKKWDAFEELQTDRMGSYMFALGTRCGAQREDEVMLHAYPKDEPASV